MRAARLGLALVASAAACLLFATGALARPAGEPVKKKKSNEVEVEAAIPSFSVVKEQRLKGEAAYTKATLTSASVPVTVEYLITVTDTGETAISVEELKDPDCENVRGPSSASLEPHGSATYTCEHTVTEAGKTYTNLATVKAAGKEEPSNEVEVRTAGARFEIVKEQKLASGSVYTKETLTTKVGETVDYKVTVTNTGEAPQSFEAFSDPNCTNIASGATGPVTSGHTVTWTCEHKLSALGEWANVASVKGNGEAKASNKVVVIASSQEVKAACGISEQTLVLRGGSGSKRKPFTVHISSLGIKQITFYLDGRTLKKFTAPQARHGEFAVVIDPAKLRYGAHKVSIKTVMTDQACATIARSSVFVHAKPAAATPKFTG